MNIDRRVQRIRGADFFKCTFVWFWAYSPLLLTFSTRAFPLKWVKNYVFFAWYTVIHNMSNAQVQHPSYPLLYTSLEIEQHRGRIEMFNIPYEYDRQYTNVHLDVTGNTLLFLPRKCYLLWKYTKKTPNWLVYSWTYDKGK